MTSTSAVLLDSSVWIEIFNSGPLLKSCKKELDEATFVLVPTTVIFEVYRKITQTVSDDFALSAISILSKYETVNLTSEIALSAGDLSIQYGLGMADSFILAHAVARDAKLVTLDNDFANLPSTKVIRH